MRRSRRLAAIVGNSPHYLLYRLSKPICPSSQKPSCRPKPKYLFSQNIPFSQFPRMAEPCTYGTDPVKICSTAIGPLRDSSDIFHFRRSLEITSDVKTASRHKKHRGTITGNVFARQSTEIKSTFTATIFQSHQNIIFITFDILFDRYSAVGRIGYLQYD